MPRLDRQTLAELARLAGAAGRLAGAPGSDEVLTSLCAASRTVTGAAACSIAVLDPKAAELVYRASDGAGAEGTVGLRLPLSRGVAGFALNANQAIEIDHVTDDPRFAADLAERTGYIPRRLLAVPIRVGGEPAGVLSVLDRDPDLLSASAAISFARSLAEVAARVVSSQAAFDRIGGVIVGGMARLDGETAWSDALARAVEEAPPESRVAGDLAVLLAELSELGDRERAAALELLRSFTSYARPTTRR